MKKTIAFFYSSDPNMEGYISFERLEKEYDLKFKDMGRSNFGGEAILEVEGELSNMNRFAKEECGCEEGIEDLEWVI